MRRYSASSCDTSSGKFASPPDRRGQRLEHPPIDLLPDADAEDDASDLAGGLEHLLEGPPAAGAGAGVVFVTAVGDDDDRPAGLPPSSAVRANRRARRRARCRRWPRTRRSRRGPSRASVPRSCDELRASPRTGSRRAASSGRSASTKLAAAAFAVSADFFMLPLASSASTIDTGVTASWKVSTVCSTPSSIDDEIVGVDVDEPPLGVGDRELDRRHGPAAAWARSSRRGREPCRSASPVVDGDRAPAAVELLVRRRVGQQVAVLHVGGEGVVHRARARLRGWAGTRGRRSRSPALRSSRSPLSEMPATPPMPTT